MFENPSLSRQSCEICIQSPNMLLARVSRGKRIRVFLPSLVVEEHCRKRDKKRNNTTHNPALARCPGSFGSPQGRDDKQGD